ncbi:MAG: FtsX-like permease family protein, partial [Pseudomonadota bacterium]
MTDITSQRLEHRTVTDESHSAVTLGLALKFALRELRGGLSGFYIFLACIALGVAAISGVNAVALSITSGISEEGRTLLGGDIAFRTTQRPLTPDERTYVEGLGATSSAVTMRAMARTVDGSEQALVELKAVNDAWPLIGNFTTAPAEAATRLQEENVVVVEPLLLTRMGLKLGDSLNIGSATAEIIGTISNEPDRISDNFALGPKLLMGKATLETSQLVRPGSLLNYTERVAVNDISEDNLKALVAETKEKFPDAGWRIRSRGNAAPALTRNVDRFSQFLTLVGLTALIVGGVGVANAVRAFLDTKSGVIASFKSLGAPAWFTFSVYLIQILLLALVGIAIGLAIGAVMPWIAKIALADILPVGNAGGFHPAVLLSAIAYGLLTALAFALWPLGQARDIPATALFRNASREDAPLPRWPYQVATAIVVLALAGLAVSQAADKRVALTFIGGIAFSFVLLRAVASGIQWLA